MDERVGRLCRILAPAVSSKQRSLQHHGSRSAQSLAKLAEVNQDRSNYRFAIIGPDSVDQWGGFCDFEVDTQRRLVEPRPQIRGEIARMVLYMVGEYGIDLPSGQHSLMIEWHCTDNVPSAEEIRHNRVIADLQRTRNPYIDNPGLLCDDSEIPGPTENADNVWEECDIKGNINRSGERIYHTRESASYASTRINTAKGERWFCTVEEAQSAGWRAPR